MQECPSETCIRDYAAGLLPASASAELKLHLLNCEKCRDRLPVPGRAPISSISEPDDDQTLIEVPLGPSPVAGHQTVAPLPQESISGYEILQEIHRGGQGVVYQALQKTTRRRVAIKVMREGPFAGPRDRARFDREVQILAALNHPGIVAIHDSGQSGGSFYFVMDYISGRPLDAWTAGGGRPVREVLGLFVRICEAVNAAHLRGVIHRDLKPGNIRIDAEGEPHILDFGLAKMAGGQVAEEGQPQLMTLTGQFVGSLPWASPEQAEGSPGKIDVRTDVYSLGVILFQMLTGRFPYEVVGSMRDVLDRIIHSEPLRPSTLRQDIDDEVETIVLKCLAKERDRRYQSAGELARDLGRYLAGEPIEAKRDSALYVLRKTLHRYRTPVAVAGGFLGVLLIATLVSLTLWRQAVEEWNSAQASEGRARNAQATEARHRMEADFQRDLATAARQEAEEARRLAEQERIRADERAETARWRLYVNQIHLADEQYRTNPNRMRVLLDECPLELRGWEWYRLRWLSDRSRLTLYGHSGGIQCIASSPDGRWVASAGTDGFVRLWDSRTGEESPPLRCPSRPITALAFSPDGARIAAGCQNGTLHTWDMAARRPILHWNGHGRADNALNRAMANVLKFSPVAVYSLAFSKDGRRLASSSDDQNVILWNAETGESLHNLPTRWPMQALAFSEDGSELLGYTVNSIQSWETATGKVVRSISWAGSWAAAVAFSPDARRAAGCGADGVVRVRETTSGRVLANLSGHRRRVSALSFRADGKQVASAAIDGTIKVWDIESGREVLTLRGHSSHVASLFYSRDGSRIFSGSVDGSLKIWDLDISSDVLALSGHDHTVFSVAAGANGETVATGSADGLVRLWEPSTGQLKNTCRGHEGAVYDTAFSPDGERIVSASADGTVRVWRTDSGAVVRTLSGHQSSVRAVAVSPDGRFIASGGGDRTVRLWNLATSSELLTLRGHTDQIVTVAFRPDGALLASGGLDGTLRLWDPASGRPVNTLSSHTGALRCVAFSPRDDRLAAAGDDGSIHLFEVATGKEGLSLSGHGGPVFALAFSPDGERMISGGEDATLKVWDATTGEEVFTLGSHESAVHGLAFSADGSRVFSASADRTARIWPSLPQPAISSDFRFRLLVEGGWKPDWSPDGRRIAYGRPRGRGINVLDLDSGLTTRLTELGKDPSWSPDGRLIAYVHEAVWNASEEEIRVVPVDGGEPRTLAKGTWPSWSQDGSLLYFYSAPKQQIMACKTGDPHSPPVAVMGLLLSQLPKVSPDGTRVAYPMLTSESFDLVVAECPTGATLGRWSWPPPHNGYVGLAWSPDGARLAIGDGLCYSGLKILDTQTGEMVQVAKECFVSPAWSPDGRKLAFDYRGPDPDRWQVWMAEIGKPERRAEPAR